MWMPAALSGRRAWKRSCRCSFWVTAPDTRHWKPSLGTTQTVQRVYLVDPACSQPRPLLPMKPYGPSRGGAKMLHVPRCIYSIVVLTRLSYCRRDRATALSRAQL